MPRGVSRPETFDTEFHPALAANGQVTEGRPFSPLSERCALGNTGYRQKRQPTSTHQPEPLIRPISPTLIAGHQINTTT
jgi:hypothetical protein